MGSGFRCRLPAGIPSILQLEETLLLGMARRHASHSVVSVWVNSLPYGSKDLNPDLQHPICFDKPMDSGF